LVQWKDTIEEEATWVDWEELKNNFPHLEGKIFLNEKRLSLMEVSKCPKKSLAVQRRTTWQ
jgi:hypothetical protein